MGAFAELRSASSLTRQQCAVCSSCSQLPTAVTQMCLHQPIFLLQGCSRCRVQSDRGSSLAWGLIHGSTSRTSRHKPFAVPMPCSACCGAAAAAIRACAALGSAHKRVQQTCGAIRTTDHTSYTAAVLCLYFVHPHDCCEAPYYVQSSSQASCNVPATPR